MTVNVLILCTHNSARSVLAEGMLNHLAAKAGNDVRAFSAGSAPSGRLNPFALDALTNAGVDVSYCRSKGWDEFVGDDKPAMHIVNFELTRQAIGFRMLQLLALPLDSMSNADLQRALTAISQS